MAYKVNTVFLLPGEMLHMDKKINAADLLASGAETYRERNPMYGDNYHHFGSVMAALFPEGLPEKMTIETYNRLGVLIQIVTKLSRYAQQLQNGGHLDSAHDMMVYAAMLEELTLK